MCNYLNKIINRTQVDNNLPILGMNKTKRHGQLENKKINRKKTKGC